MNLSFITSLFSKDKKPLILPNSILLNRLKALSQEHSFAYFNDVTIFHHTLAYHFPLIILDETRGLYIFESKDWAYDDLKNATVEKAQHQESSKETLSFQNKQDIINQKFNELTHQSDVPIFNYLLMENLNADQYEHLHDSFKTLLPLDKVIFNDTSAKNILQKLHSSPTSLHPLPSKDYILGNLFIQYTLLDYEHQVKLCSQEQINIINHEIYSIQTLQAPAMSGKTSLILLKAIFHVLSHKKTQVLIIKPTILACDLLKKKLVEIIEHAIIDFDILNVLILTPDEVLKMKKTDLPKLILCDDTNLLEENFIQSLITIQKDANLLLVNNEKDSPEYLLTQTFTSHDKSISFFHANKQAKTLLHLFKLLQNCKAEDIYIISDEKTRIELQEDLESYIDEKTSFIDSSQRLITQALSALTFIDIKSIDGLSPKHLILLDIKDKDEKYIEQSIYKTQESVTFIYEEETNFMTNLKEKYESN